MKPDPIKLAEIIKQYAEDMIDSLRIENPDPYAELKEALVQGKVIQWHDDLSWIDHIHPSDPNPLWIHPVKDLRIKPEQPWTLTRELPGFRALRDGEEWHRQDFTKEMLDGGWRPSLLNEPAHKTDEIFHNERWITDACDVGFPMLPRHLHTRTKRPLPILTKAQIADGWIEWHGGENPIPGKLVEIMIRTGSTQGYLHTEPLRWKHIQTDGDIIAYRVIEPKLVPLGPEDVRCGDELMRNSETRHGINIVEAGGVNISMFGFVSWHTLKSDWSIRRRNSETFEPCSKEEAQ